MAVAVNDLRLDALYVVYPSEARYAIDDRITAIPAGVPFSVTDAAVMVYSPCRGKASKSETGRS